MYQIMKNFQILLVLAIIAIKCEEITLLEKISAEIGNGKIKNVTQMCQIKSSLIKLHELDTSSNSNGIHDTISFLSSVIEKSGGKCDSDEIRRPTRNLINGDSNDVFLNKSNEDISKSNINSENDTIEATSSKYLEYQEDFEKTRPDNEAITMEDYVQLEGENSEERSLCTDCEMDYNDSETNDFNRGIKSAEETGTRGNHKIASIMTGAGFGALLLIGSLLVATYFGIKKCSHIMKDENSASDDLENIRSGRTPYREMA